MADPARAHRTEITDTGTPGAPQHPVSPILFAEPPRPGRNRVVWRGPVTSAEHVASSISAATGQTVRALWRRTGGGWQHHVPGEPGRIYIDSRESLIVELMD